MSKENIDMFEQIINDIKNMKKEISEDDVVYVCGFNAGILAALEVIQEKFFTLKHE